VLRISGVFISAATGLALILLLLGGGVLVGLGVVGFYLGRVYDEVKARPRYVVSRTCGKK
jgi:dolichol-phosphate mannosyltransferase